MELKLSEVIGESKDFRIDSEFIVKKPFENPNLKYKKIGEILKKSQYGISIDMNEDNKGYPIYRMNEIHNLVCDFEVSKYANISSDEKEIFKLTDRDILFNRTNSFEFVGRTGIYYKNTEDVRDYIFASYLIRLVPNKEIKPELLNVFLNTKYGIQDIKRRARISINQSNVNAEEVKNIKIPIFSNTFQSQIETLVKTAYEKLKESKKLYKEAEELLLEELDLKDYQPSDENIAIKSFSQSFGATGRFDSEYYQPKYDEILEKIKSYKGGWDLVKNICNIKDKNFKPTEDKKYKYIELSNIGNEGDITGFTFDMGKNLPSRARRVVKKDDIIISSIEGSLEKVALVTKEFDNSLCSTGFYVINSKEINSKALLIIFKNSIYQQILKQNCSGTILTAINKDEFYNLPIPKIDKNIQGKMEQKVKDSFQLKKESKELLDLAVKAVEIAIEKDENEAMEFVNENN